MIHVRRSLLAALVALASGGWAATTPGEPKDVAMRLKATGTLVEVDATGRRLALKGPRGVAHYTVDPRVDNLAQFQPGDRVRVDYVAALVLTLKRDVPTLSGPRTDAAPEGSPVPTGTSAAMKVLAVDRKAQKVRLQGPTGRASDFRVQDAADLVGVRPGDRVLVVLHEAVVVGLESASK